MDAITKALERSNAVINTAVARFDRQKGVNMMENMTSPSLMSAPTDWQQQSKQRENYAHFRSWVYAAINALADHAAKQPVCVGKLNNEQNLEEEEIEEKLRRGVSLTKDERIRRIKRKRLINSMSKLPRYIQQKSIGGDLEVFTNHKLIDILDNPNPLQGRYQFVYTFVSSINLTGVAYIVLDEDENGNTLYYALPSTWVKPVHEKGSFAQYTISNPQDLDFTKSEPIDGSLVARAYMPNPSNPMSCVSPASCMSSAIRVDDRIQTCQEKFFDNGVFPSVVVSIGKDPHPDVPGGIRPRLTGTQRRQVIGAIRRVMGSVANYGNPAIVDGLIESITPVSRTQSELGWDKSEDKLKNRILSAFCVHPFILGDPLNVGGYAQAYNIMGRFCDRVNTFLEMLSTIMTGFANKENSGKVITTRGYKLLVWWTEAAPNDPSLEWTNWRFARSEGDVTSNELRAKLGLPPSEKPEAMINKDLVPGIISLLTNMGMGSIQATQGQALLEALGVPIDVAGRICMGQSGESGGSEIEQALSALNEAIASIRIQHKLLGADSIIDAVCSSAE